MRYFLIFILLGVGSANAETCPDGGWPTKKVVKTYTFANKTKKIIVKMCCYFPDHGTKNRSIKLVWTPPKCITLRNAQAWGGPKPKREESGIIIRKVKPIEAVPEKKK